MNREDKFIESLREFQNNMESKTPEAEYKKTWVKRIVTKLMDDSELMNEFNLQMRSLKLKKLKGDD